MHDAPYMKEYISVKDDTHRGSGCGGRTACVSARLTEELGRAGDHGGRRSERVHTLVWFVARVKGFMSSPGKEVRERHTHNRPREALSVAHSVCSLYAKRRVRLPMPPTN